MKIRAAVLAVSMVIPLSAAVVVSSSTTPAVAQDPACTIPAGEMPTFSSLPSTAVVGRRYEFEVDDLNMLGGSDLLLPGGRATVRISQSSRLLSSGTYEFEDDIPLLAKTGGTITVNATVPYTAYDDSTLTNVNCTTSISRPVRTIAGRAIPKPQLRHVTGDMVGSVYVDSTYAVALQRPKGCAASYAPSPVMFSAHLSGVKTWTRALASDQCTGWDKDKVAGKGLLLGPDILDLSHKALVFAPKTSAKNSTKLYAYKLTKAVITTHGAKPGKVLAQGHLQVVTHHTPARRIYGMVNGQINDDYWNYCVNGGETVWMDNGNPYCVEPGYTTRKVTKLK